eukprot:CAMPEP_0194038196 /NCGR_PEP_ID=MMETSP0009_2-20130614/10461_1 /TAXON_ID=210454 /ORGANISM="Grammatophora oceanica, Strain CCMP 410" /LENGTH=168 /DNA_ID=CAMNT_0038680619 /DNA_START=37 /DNA_END=543 /DNA_ORIENTATION=-
MLNTHLLLAILTLWTGLLGGSVSHAFQASVPPSIVLPRTSSVQPAVEHHSTTTKLFGGFMDEVGTFFKRFTQKASASHILIKGGPEAANKLEELKVEIDNSPVKFAEAASRFSSCPSARKGGELGEFGPGQMVKEFDQVVFNDDVGVVHGPIKTQFGYHLIYVTDRTE